MNDNNIFVSGSNQKTLQVDAIHKIKVCYKAHIILICTSDPADCWTKMNKFPYLYLTKSGCGIKMIDINDFTHAFTSYKKNNTKLELVADSDDFIITMDINILYPPIDVSLDCFDFTKLSLTFPVHPYPAAPQVQFDLTQVQPQQQGLAPSDDSLIAQSITEL